MQSLLYSPFLQALGYSIINSLWQFALLWLLYFAVNTIFKLSSHQKYLTGLVLEITGFTWFVVTLIFYYNQSLLLPQSGFTDQAYLPGLLTGTGGTLKQQFFLLVLRSERFFPYLSVAYLALLLVLGLRWMYAYRFTRQVRFEGLKEIESEWKIFVQKLSLELGIKRPVQVFLSELVETPLTVGSFKPLILIPLATINYLNTQQMEAVILHELAHIKRYDYLFNLVLALIEACLFFNPFMQLIHQQIKKERENCCDDWVLKYEYGAASYARALLQIASNQKKTPLLALHATDDKKLLITRIKRIIEKNERTFFNHKHQLLALLVLTTVFSSLSFLSSSKKKRGSSNRAAQENVVYEPMAAKVKNPLFNPVFFLATTPKVSVEVAKKSGEIKSAKAKVEESTFSTAGAFDAIPSNAVPAIPEAVDENDKMVESSATYRPTEANPVVIVNSSNLPTETLRNDTEKGRLTQLKLEEWFSKDAPKQFEIVENQLRKLQGEFTKEKTGVLTAEKVRTQLNNVVEQLKPAKKRVELIKLRTLVRLGISKIEKEKLANLLTEYSLPSTNELKLLEGQIESAIDSIEEPTFFSTRLNSDAGYYFQLPAVVYTLPKEKEHSFSFEYSTKPKVRVITTQCLKAAENTQKKKEDVLVVDSEENDLEPAAPTPPLPTTKVRSAYVIKI